MIQIQIAVDGTKLAVAIVFKPPVKAGLSSRPPIETQGVEVTAEPQRERVA